MTPPDAADRAREIRRMFSGIAPTYDLLNRILSLGVDAAWRRRLVSRLPQSRIRVLDLACGTADVALEIAAARPRSLVFGADFSLPMLRQARPKIAAHRVRTAVCLQAASAEHLPYRDGAFHAVTMAFGIRNVVRRDRALGEIRRVLARDGLALILDFSMPRNRLVRVAYGVYFRRLLPLLGGLVSGNYRAYRYLPRSVEGFPSRREFARMMEDEGFTGVGFEDYTFGIATLYWGRRP